MSWTLWIFSDQDPKVTGVFYRDYAQALYASLGTAGGVQPSIRLRYLDLGKIEHHPEKCARSIHACLDGRDRCVIIRDVEDRGPRRVDVDRLALVAALERLGIGEDRAMVVLIHPTTECAYLLDDATYAELESWYAGRTMRGRDGRRRAVVPNALAALRADRVRAARGGVEPPSKRRVQDVLAVRDEDKEHLARRAGAAVKQPGWAPPAEGQVRALDELIAWLGLPRR